MDGSAPDHGGEAGSSGAGGTLDDGGYGGAESGSTGGGGGSSGSGGSAATGGASGGSGGSSGAGGAGGVAGSGGNGGSAPTDAANDAGGTAGAGGAADSGGATPDAMTSGLSVRYAALKAQASSAYVQCELHADNTGSSLVPLSELKLRYYFSDDVKKTPQITINWSHVCVPGNCGSTLAVTSTVNALTPPEATADTYLEFSFSSNHPILGPGDTADFAFQMQGPNPAADVYTQTNDYSFDASKTTPSNWDHVVLLRDTAVVWGLPP
jgi:endoglucanase